MAPLWSSASVVLSLSLGAAAWPYSTYSSMGFQPPQLEVNQTGTTADGLLFLGPRGGVQPAGQAALIYDNAGNLVYEGPEEVTANFMVQQLNGSDVITFWAGDMLDLGFGYGTVHILDNTYQEIHTVTLTGDFVTADGQTRESYIDLHESHITPQNTLLVTAYNVTQHDLTSVGGNSTDYMLDSHFYEIDISTNEILNSWSALDHEDQIPLTTSHQKIGVSGTSENPWDAYHINAITATNHGYLVSLRHMWSGFYLDHNGTIIWHISGDTGGDFAPSGNTNFSWQHDMRVHNETDDGLILNLFNNANTGSDSEGDTTGLSLSINLQDKTVTGLKSLSDPNDPIKSVSQGSYQLLGADEDANVFMDYGSISKVKEYDGNGNIVFTAQFGDDNAVASYRGYRCQWSAVPFWKPSLYVNRTSDGASVYMSWNGATDYDSWNIYAPSSVNSTAGPQIGNATRTGFETRVDLTDLPTNYIQVSALQDGNILGSSEVVPF
ncbi:hypothetical protein N7468_007146 [Penicillium chermesinum]|uniref:ASST-domain-containing protein n=1 Tax=Penicillium chermesinum TaxID=63820 RepID=A0A9W9TKA2_9EURO|nr:uncharacterized protein N7468_007146 [Penicillium chermesinum]KAJ5225921.1 hypothetical protein N7468_007146 [Penicillium chermesinum]KAJ6160872.1 hypothetical protein N7470_004268 [Penicillium chermesinum]